MRRFRTNRLSSSHIYKEMLRVAPMIIDSAFVHPTLRHSHQQEDVSTEALPGLARPHSGLSILGLLIFVEWENGNLCLGKLPWWQRCLS